MPRSKPTSGTCSFCGQTVTKQGATRHRPGCPDYQVALQRAERSSRRAEPIFQLRAQDAYGGRFWLDLEMRSSATLKDLDGYLRAIWLECCGGHMSQFAIGGWRGEEIRRSRRAASVFQPGVERLHGSRKPTILMTTSRAAMREHSSSGAIGTAMNDAIAVLAPIIFGVVLLPISAPRALVFVARAQPEYLARR